MYTKAKEIRTCANTLHSIKERPMSVLCNNHVCKAILLSKIILIKMLFIYLFHELFIVYIMDFDVMGGQSDYLSPLELWIQSMLQIYAKLISVNGSLKTCSTSQVCSRFLIHSPT